MRVGLGVGAQILHDIVVQKVHAHRCLKTRKAILRQRSADHKRCLWTQQLFQISLHRIHLGEGDEATEMEQTDVVPVASGLQVPANGSTLRCRIAEIIGS